MTYGDGIDLTGLRNDLYTMCDNELIIFFYKSLNLQILFMLFFM